MSVVAHFFMSVGGSEIHERLAHFFIDFYTPVVPELAECSSAILVSLTQISMRNAGRSTMLVRLVNVSSILTA